MNSSLFAAVVHGSQYTHSDAAPLAVLRSAATASGSEGKWFGDSPEEKSKILSWVEADLSNEKLLFADLEKRLENSSFVGLPSRETAADLVVFSVLNTKVLPASFQQTNPNVARWLNHMQAFVAKSTGNQQFRQFKVSGLRTTAVHESPSESVGKKEEKPQITKAIGEEKSTGKKESEKVEKKQQK